MHMYTARALYSAAAGAAAQPTCQHHAPQENRDQKQGTMCHGHGVLYVALQLWIPIYAAASTTNKQKAF